MVQLLIQKLFLPAIFLLVFIFLIFLLVQTYRKNSRTEENKRFSFKIGGLWALLLASMVLFTQVWIPESISLQTGIWAFGFILLLLAHETYQKRSHASALKAGLVTILITPVCLVALMEVLSLLISPLALFLRSF